MSVKLPSWKRGGSGDGQDISAPHHHLLRHQLPTECAGASALRHFRVSTVAEAARAIKHMSQRDLQNMFRLVYGTRTFSNNNNWLRRKLSEAVGIESRAPGVQRRLSGGGLVGGQHPKQRRSSAPGARAVMSAEDAAAALLTLSEASACVPEWGFVPRRSVVASAPPPLPTPIVDGNEAEAPAAGMREPKLAAIEDLLGRRGSSDSGCSSSSSGWIQASGAGSGVPTVSVPTAPGAVGQSAVASTVAQTSSAGLDADVSGRQTAALQTGLRTGDVALPQVVVVKAEGRVTPQLLISRRGGGAPATERGSCPNDAGTWDSVPSTTGRLPPEVMQHLLALVESGALVGTVQHAVPHPPLAGKVIGEGFGAGVTAPACTMQVPSLGVAPWQIKPLAAGPGGSVAELPGFALVGAATGSGGSVTGSGVSAGTALPEVRLFAA